MRLRALAFAAAVALLAPAVPLAQDQSLQFAQADFREPQSAEEALDSRISVDASELTHLKEIFGHIDRARRDHLSGRVESGLDEDKIAASQIIAFVNKYKAHRLRIVFYKMAATRFLNAKDWEQAGDAAQRMMNDPKALPVTKAIGARYACGAWQMLAIQEMRAGAIPQLKLKPSGARGGAAHEPRVPDRAWRLFVEAADVYAKNVDADPSSKLSEEERKVQGGTDVGQLQLIAAQVEFGYDNIEDAQRRFGVIIEKYPARADLLETAVPYYLDTFKILKDTKGLEAAGTRIQPIVAAEAKRAGEAAAAPGASEEQKKTAATLARLAKELQEGGSGGEAGSALAIMEKAAASAKAGDKAKAEAQYREAAALFEKYAKDNKDRPDAPESLFNAAIAHDKAGEAKKAVAVRESIVASYPNAKVMPQTLLLLASGLGGSRDYPGAAKYYKLFLEKFPEAPQRCAVMQNLGAVEQESKKPLDAVAAYLKFAGDAGCAGEDPNTTARVLYNAAKLQVDAKKTADARKTLQALVDLKGVTDVVAKSYQADAKDRLKKMK